MSDSWLQYNSFGFCSPKIIRSDMKMWKTTNPSSWWLAGMVWFINNICLTVCITTQQKVARQHWPSDQFCQKQRENILTWMSWEREGIITECCTLTYLYILNLRLNELAKSFVIRGSNTQSPDPSPIPFLSRASL